MPMLENYHRREKDQKMSFRESSNEKVWWKGFFDDSKLEKKVFFLFLLEQRCPTIFLRLPQLWQINMTFRHKSKNIAESTLNFKKMLPRCVKIAKIFVLGHFRDSFQFFLAARCKINWHFLIFPAHTCLELFLFYKAFATFKMSFATCHKWRMGWTALFKNIGLTVRSLQGTY